MTQNDTKILNELETSYSEIQAMNVEIVFQTETGETDSFLTDTWRLLELRQTDLLKKMNQIETMRQTEPDGAYRVVTRNETRLGTQYQSDAVALLETVFKMYPDETILEVQWG